MFQVETNPQDKAPLTATATTIIEKMEGGKTIPHILLSDGSVTFGIASIEKHGTATEKGFSVMNYFITRDQQVVAVLSAKTGSLVEFSSIPEPAHIQLITFNSEGSLSLATKKYGEYDKAIKHVIVTKSTIYAIDPMLSIESVAQGDTDFTQRHAA